MSAPAAKAAADFLTMRNKAPFSFPQQTVTSRMPLADPARRMPTSRAERLRRTTAHEVGTARRLRFSLRRFVSARASDTSELQASPAGSGDEVIGREMS